MPAWLTADSARSRRLLSSATCRGGQLSHMLGVRGRDMAGCFEVRVPSVFSQPWWTSPVRRLRLPEIKTMFTIVRTLLREWLGYDEVYRMCNYKEYTCRILREKR
jgi:hypothetical protein